MKQWVAVFAVAFAVQARAASFSVELGQSIALVQFRPAALSSETAVSLRFEPKSWGGFELLGRGFLLVPFRGPLGGGGLVTARYRTPSLTAGMFDFNLAAGVGLTLFSFCSGDVCNLAIGPGLELAPTVELNVLDAVRPWLALNVTTAYLIRGVVWTTAGLALGVTFDFVTSVATMSRSH